MSIENENDLYEDSPEYKQALAYIKSARISGVQWAVDVLNRKRFRGRSDWHLYERFGLGMVVAENPLEILGDYDVVCSLAAAMIAKEKDNAESPSDEAASN